MVNLKVEQVADNKYFLINIKTAEKYCFNISFFGIKSNVERGDIIVIHEELLDKNYVEYSTSYQFGPIEEKYGRNVSNMNHIDCVGILKNNGKKITLKRFFG